MKKNLLVTIAVLVIAIALVAGYFVMKQKTGNIDSKANPNEPAEIVIGYNADQSTGPTAAFGVWGRQGFEIATDEINAAGGILGKKIRTVILDDKADKEISKKNMEQLIFQEKALATIGPAGSANAVYILDTAQNNEEILINHIAGVSGITTKFSERPRNYIFRIANLDVEQVRLLVASGVKQTNNGKFAIIYDSTAYGTEGVKDVIEVLARWGKTPVFTKSFNRGTAVEDLVPIIKSAKEAGADAIVFYALVDSNADLLKALDQIKGYNPVLLGTAANAVNLWQLAGPLASKLTFTSPMSADFNERAKELNQKIINKYGKAPAILSSAASGYDSVTFLKAAIEQAGTLDRVAVRDALENVTNVQGVMRFFNNPFSKQNHDALKVTDAFLAHWADGKIVLLDEDISKLEIR